MSVLSSTILNSIYSEFSNSSALIGKAKLNEADFKYLRSRGLTEETIKEAGFFSMPDKPIIKPFLTRLEALDFKKHLGNVPGFYYDTKYNTWTYLNLPSIVIPIKDEFGNTVALQLRSTEPNPKVRYIWFSSKFAEGKEPNDKGFCYGCSSGAPLSILYPSKPSSTLAITEGWFKANKLTELGLPTISCQGVYSINKDSLCTIENIGEIQKKNIENIKIFFDADYCTNLNVIKAINKVIGILNDKYSVQIAYWNIHYGKGIDDYLENKDMHTVEFINATNFIDLSNKVIKEAKSQGLKQNDKEGVYRIFNRFKNSQK